MSSAPTMMPLQVAVKSLVQKISNVSDLDMDINKSWKKDNSTTIMDYFLVFRGTKTSSSSSSSALVRLNASISDKSFSTALSAAMGTPVTVTGSYQRYVSETPRNSMRDPRTASKKQIEYSIPRLAV